MDTIKFDDDFLIACNETSKDTIGRVEKKYLLTFAEKAKGKRQINVLGKYDLCLAEPAKEDTIVILSKHINFHTRDGVILPFGTKFIDTIYSGYEEFMKSPYKSFDFQRNDFIFASMRMNTILVYDKNLTFDLFNFLTNTSTGRNFENVPDTNYLDKEFDFLIDKNVYSQYAGLGGYDKNHKWVDVTPFEVVEHINKLKKEGFAKKCVSYKCQTLDEIFFCMLHYYLTNGYTVNTCSLCQRQFITNIPRKKYCDRNSNIPRYSHLLCVNAQQRIRKNNSANHPLKKRYNVLLSTFDRLIDQKNLDENIKKEFIKEAKIQRTTNTDEEYSQWLASQELLYKKRQQKRKVIHNEHNHILPLFLP